MSSIVPPKWEPGRWPTPREFVEWFEANGPDEREEIAANVIEQLQRAHRCQMVHS